MKKTSTLILSAIFIVAFSLNVSTNKAFTKEDKSPESQDKKDDTSEDKKKEKKIEINESEFKSAQIGALLEHPENFIDKKIKFRGKFSSFTTLALDYEPALRKSKDYISICIFRPDSKIPLSELKLAYPVKEAKENLVIRELEEGDLIEIYAQVFSAALDEPWADILQIKKIESADKSKNDKKDKDAKALNDNSKETTKNKKGKKDLRENTVE